MRAGLTLLVGDNATTVAAMLGCDSGTSIPGLCEKCAGVLRQQQLSPASFLGRFFETSVLSPHAIKLSKSGKGSSAILAERIAGEWSKNRMPPAVAAGGGVQAPQAPPKEKNTKKRKLDKDVHVGNDAAGDAVPKKKHASAESAKPAKPLATKCYTLEFSLAPGDENSKVDVHSVHTSAKEAAEVAWGLCEQHRQSMPSADWCAHTRDGEQDCTRVMTSEPSWNWGPREEFVNYMAKMSRKGTIRLSGPGAIVITKGNLVPGQ